MSELTKAIIQAQLEIKPPVKDKINPRFKSSYASIDSIYAAIREPLFKNGIDIDHEFETIDGKTYVTTTLKHISGEEKKRKVPIFIENQGNQSFGSACTYARRYGICCLLALPSDEDDDGEAAENPLLSQKQINDIMNSIGDRKDILDKMLRGYGKSSIKEILATEFDPIIKRIEAIKSRENNTN